MIMKVVPSHYNEGQALPRFSTLPFLVSLFPECDFVSSDVHCTVKVFSRQRIVAACLSVVVTARSITLLLSL